MNMKSRAFVPALMLLCVAAWPSPLLAQQPLTAPESIVSGLVPITGGEGVPESRSVDLTVEFALGSADLTDEGRVQLDALGSALADPRLDGLVFVIIGHTDATGAEDANQRLSEDRARAVATYLADRQGVPSDRLRTRGEGETRLKNPFDGSAAENRRVEIFAYLPGPAEPAGASSGAITAA